MPRTIQIQPLSLLVGVGFALLGLVAMGQMPAANRPAAQHDSMYLKVAHPRDWVVIEQGQPFVVPPGRFLVITALGHTFHAGTSSRLVVNGLDVATGRATSTVHGPVHSSSMIKVEPGLRLVAGDSVEAIDLNTQGQARAWGYLVDA